MLALAAALPSSARASVQQAAGRVYTLAPAPASRLLLSMAVARDGTVYAVEGDPGDPAFAGDGLFRLAPNSTRLREIKPHYSFSDVTAGARGDILLSDAFLPPRVWRLSPDGTLAVAAGANGEDQLGIGGDGGPATSAQLCSPFAVAGLADGGFVFSDGPYSVRRVSADGVISTVAVTVMPPVCSQATAPAPEAASAPETIADLAGMPDGGFTMLLWGAERSRVVRVAPSGEWSTLASAGAISSISVAADGALFAIVDGTLARWPAGGGRRAVVLTSRSGSRSIFDGDGSRPARYSALDVRAVAHEPDGGIVAIAAREYESDRVIYIAPAVPQRMAVALLPHEGRAGATGYVARYLVTRPGTASLVVRDARGHTVATTKSQAVAGRNTLALRHRLRAGVYTVRLIVTAVDGRRSSDSLNLALGGQLSLRLARDTLRPDSFCGSNCEDEVRDGPCQRFGPGRVDCRFSVNRRPECASALLTRYGAVRGRAYACPPSGRPPFPRRPRYDGHSREAGPVQDLSGLP